MCRITGVIKFDNTTPDECEVAAMRDSMSHGGPDDRGMLCDGGVALAHRRLSIIDLSTAAHQPMKAAGRPVWITYNGEIFNYREIRQELASLGHLFSSDSDTEVVLQAYLQWGEGAFSRFNGMFAFCIYDREQGLAYLVRDQAGIKPLYYSASAERLVFSSEVKAFRHLDNNWPQEERWPIYFLAFGHIPEPFSTLKDVFMLPAGCFMKLQIRGGKSSISVHSHFTYSQNVANLAEARLSVRDLVSKSVERHLISDVPIGVFLSGGLDSSIIAISAAAKNKRIRTLSIIFNEESFSERKYQSYVVERIKSEHSECLVTREDFLSEVPEFLKHIDQPTVDGINTWFITKCARKAGLKAVLSGLGADEIFGGYSSFSRMGGLWPLRHIEGYRNGFRLMDQLRYKSLKRLSYLSLNSELSFYLTLRGLFTPEEISRKLGVSIPVVYEALEKIAFRPHPSDISSKNYASAMETQLYMRNQLLKDTDFISMAQGIEVRVPFLDKDLLSYVCTVADPVKYGRKPKSLLKDAFSDVLDGEMMHRPKMGFTFPFDIWLNSRDVKLPGIDSEALGTRRLSGCDWAKTWAGAVLSDFQGKN